MSDTRKAQPLLLKAKRAFGAFTLDCELALELGGILGLFGPSGCGKSSLLRIIAGLDRAPGDKLNWQGRALSELLPEARRIGLVFQDSRLFPHLSVLGNLQLAAARGEGAGSPKCWRPGSALPNCCPSRPTASPAASASGWHWPVPCWPSPICCCWMNLFLRWTDVAASIRPTCSRACSKRAVSR